MQQPALVLGPASGRSGAAKGRGRGLVAECASANGAAKARITRRPSLAVVVVDFFARSGQVEMLNAFNKSQRASSWPAMRQVRKTQSSSELKHSPNRQPKVNCCQRLGKLLLVFFFLVGAGCG